jgi:hypothetical protein
MRIRWKEREGDVEQQEKWNKDRRIWFCVSRMRIRRKEREKDVERTHRLKKQRKSRREYRVKRRLLRTKREQE